MLLCGMVSKIGDLAVEEESEKPIAALDSVELSKQSREVNEKSRNATNRETLVTGRHDVMVRIDVIKCLST